MFLILQIGKMFKINDKGPALSRAEGFSLLEIVISVAIFSIILFAVVSIFLSMNNSNLKTTASREVSENVRMAIEKITYEIRSAKSIYTPTTTASQLSLETSKNLPGGETNTFIDFFLCGSAICFKKESQDPVAITSNSVQITNLTFSQILTGSKPSVQIDLTANSGSGVNYSSINIKSTASLRSY